MLTISSPKAVDSNFESVANQLLASTAVSNSNNADDNNATKSETLQVAITANETVMLQKKTNKAYVGELSQSIQEVASIATERTTLMQSPFLC